MSAVHALFLDALERHGPSSNVLLANHIGTKTCKQVGVHKRIFLSDHPTWLRDLCSSTTPQETDPVSTESPDHPCASPTPEQHQPI